MPSTFHYPKHQLSHQSQSSLLVHKVTVDLLDAYKTQIISCSWLGSS